MKKMFFMNSMAVLALGLMMGSCSKESVFTPADAVEHAESVLGLNIDPNQDWKMTQEVAVNVTVNLGTGEKYTVYVFDKSPFDNDDAVYFIKQTLTDGKILYLNVSPPTAQKSLYIAVFDSKGASVARRYAIKNGTISAIFGTAMQDSYNFTRSRAFTRSNPGRDYPATSGHINANGNEWAASTTGNNPKTFGGWVVPDPLTEGQQLRARKYFQANPKLTYDDPEWRHFFVQQVYKGGDAQEGVSNENIVAASGKVNTSSDMGELYVGPNKDESFKLNPFGGGDCSVYGNVLNNGKDVNDWSEGSHHSDKIILMVNIDDTSTFTYTESGSSSAHNNKCALVSASEIDRWAALNGNPGDPVVDDWNRSFLGFDLALKEGDEAYAKDWQGNTLYAQFTDGQNSNLEYVWDGEKVLKKVVQSAPVRRAIAKRTNRSNEETITDVTSKYFEAIKNGYSYSLSYSIDDNGVMVVNFNAYGGLHFNIQDDLSSYNKFVMEFAEESGIASNGSFNFGGVNHSLSVGDTKVEIDIAGKNVNLTGFTIQSNCAGILKISRVYLVGGGDNSGDDNTGGDNPDDNPGDNPGTGGDDPGDNPGTGDNPETGEEAYETYSGNYLIVDGNQIPLLDANKNMYCGERYLDGDEKLSDSEMKIEKDGKWCFNMEKVKEMVDNGYLPVKDSNLRTWVKLGKSDGYFSDWIVTLSKAERMNEETGDDEETDGEEETHGEEESQEDFTPVVYSYAFEDSWHGDYDMNDVVVKVRQNADNEGKMDVTLCCTGASYDLSVWLGDMWGDICLFPEVHAALGGNAGKFINTGGFDSTSDKFETRGSETITVNIPGDSSLGDLDIWIKSPEGDIHVSTGGQDPHGVVIPLDWQWPTEWTRITEAYPDFVGFAADQNTNTDWYNYPASGKTY